MELGLKKAFAFVAEDGRSLSTAGRMFPRRPEGGIKSTGWGRIGLGWNVASSARTGGEE